MSYNQELFESPESPPKKASRVRAPKAKDTSKNLEIPGMMEATEHDAYEFFLLATRHDVPDGRRRAAEFLCRMKGFGTFGQREAPPVSAMEQIMDEIAERVPNGGLSDLH